MGKNPRGDISPQEFFPAGIFPHGDFFSAQYSSLEDLIQWKSIFSAFIHIYIVYGMDPAQLLHVVVKQAGKLYLRFTWSQTQRQFLRRPKGRRSNIALALNYSPIRSIFKL